jgi:hypothetical protein
MRELYQGFRQAEKTDPAHAGPGDNLEREDGQCA